jgi:3-mercaptopyruvate sulfurtransferase SseA
VAQTLLDAGSTDVRALLGGFDAWRMAGYPLEAKTNEASKSVSSKASIKEVQQNLQKGEGDEA